MTRPSCAGQDWRSGEMITPMTPDSPLVLSEIADLRDVPLNQMIAALPPGLLTRLVPAAEQSPVPTFNSAV